MNAEERRLQWDKRVDLFLAGEGDMDNALRRWSDAYDGRGEGTVVMDAFVEPYVGSVFPGDARGVVFGLNPGRALLDFQAADGIFASEIRSMGSYSKWSATWPYVRDPWEELIGPNRYPRSRWRFLRQWLGDSDLPMTGLLTVELFPWHSTRVKGAMKRVLESCEILSSTL